MGIICIINIGNCFSVYRWCKINIWSALLPFSPDLFCPGVIFCPGCWFCIPLYLKVKLGRTYSCILNLSVFHIVLLFFRFVLYRTGYNLRFCNHSPWKTILKLGYLLCDILVLLKFLIYMVKFINLQYIIQPKTPSIEINIGGRC